MKKLFKVFSILMFGWVLVACGGSEGTDTTGQNGATNGNESVQEVNYVAIQEISGLDSVLISDTNTSSYVGHIQEGLYWEDENNEVHPALAEDMPEVSEDGLTYTIKMREEAEWENGDPITADDFVFAVRRLVDPDVGASFSYLVESIENASDIIAGETGVEELGVTALDEYTVEIKLAQPTPYLLNILAFSPLYPQNRAFVEEQGEDYGTTSDTVLSSGPYTIEGWDAAAQTWAFEKNDNYYNADEIDIETINVQVIKEVTTNVNLYETGQVDNAVLQGELARQYAGHPDLVQTDLAGTMYIYFNYENEYFQNENLRAALDYAVNSQELADSVLGDGSQPLVSFVPRNFISNPETDADFVDDLNIEGKYDEAQATELWEQAQEELGVEEITLNLLASDTESVRTVTEYIQGQIQTLLPGINVTLQNVPTKNRIDQSREGDFDLLVAGWVADYADGLNFLQVLQSESNYNYGKYNNEAYDEAYHEAEVVNAGEPEARYQSMLDAHQILTEDTAFVPLYQNVNAQLRNPRIKDLTLRSVGNEFDFRTAHIEEGTE
jgi:oligopeptide transport system substrate-binding protein